MIFYKLVYYLAPGTQGWIFVSAVLFQMVWTNITLAVFNLMPVPPLDGFSVLTQVFNLEKREWYGKVYNKGMTILLILIVFGVLGRVIFPSVNFLYTFLYRLFF